MAKPLPNPRPPHWTERMELSLLNAVLEIANEPSESYDPRINLFDRINKNMEKSLTDREILDKIEELRNRFEKRCWKRYLANKDVRTTKAFAISEKIWGKTMEMKIEGARTTKKMEWKNAKSLKVNPPEASMPNPTNKRNAKQKNKCQPAGKKQKVKGSSFVSGNVGPVARDCSKMKIAKQETKQQEIKDISEGSVESQFETENKHKELSAGSVLTSSLPGSLGLTSEQTKQRDEVHDGSQPRNKIISALNVSLINPLTEQTMKINNLRSGDRQHTLLQTEQRDEAHDSSSPQSLTHQSSPEQRVKSNDSQCGDNQHVSEQTKQRDEKLDGSQPIAQDNVSSQPVAHQHSSEKRMKFNNSQRGDNRHTSEQRTKVPSKFKSGTHQHTSIQKKPANRFRYSYYQHTSYQWKREAVTPPFLPQPPQRVGWGRPYPIAMPFTPYPPPYQYPAPSAYHLP